MDRETARRELGYPLHPLFGRVLLRPCINCYGPDTRPIVFEPTRTVAAALNMMLVENRSAVVIAPVRGAVVGILTLRDVLYRVLLEGKALGEVKLAEVMTPAEAVEAIGGKSNFVDIPLVYAVNKMISGPYRHAFLFDEQGRVVRVIGLGDVLRFLQLNCKSIEFHSFDREYDWKMLNYTLGRGLASELGKDRLLVTATPRESVLAAAKRMKEERKGCVVVTFRERIRGYLTEVDVLKAALGRQALSEMACESAMRKGGAVLSTASGPTVMTALNLMIDRGSEYVFVEDEEHRLFRVIGGRWMLETVFGAGDLRAAVVNLPPQYQAPGWDTEE